MDRGSSTRHHMQRRGAALVEFAMVLPIVFLLFASMIEISRAMLLQHTADTAAYEAARCSIVPGATATESKNAARELLLAAGLTSAAIEVTPNTITEETSVITVRVDIPLSENYWVSPFLFGDYIASSEVTLFCERPSVVRLTGVPQLNQRLGARGAPISKPVSLSQR